jgi:hypothetical protein
VIEYEVGIAIIDVFPLEGLEKVRHHQVLRKRLLGMQEVLTSYLALRAPCSQSKICASGL